MFFLKLWLSKFWEKIGVKLFWNSVFVILMFFVIEYWYYWFFSMICKSDMIWK